MKRQTLPGKILILIWPALLFGCGGKMSPAEQCAKVCEYAYVCTPDNMKDIPSEYCLQTCEDNVFSLCQDMPRLIEICKSHYLCAAFGSCKPYMEKYCEVTKEDTECNAASGGDCETIKKCDEDAQNTLDEFEFKNLCAEYIP